MTSLVYQGDVSVETQDGSLDAVLRIFRDDFAPLAGWRGSLAAQSEAGTLPPLVRGEEVVVSTSDGVAVRLIPGHVVGGRRLSITGVGDLPDFAEVTTEGEGGDSASD